MDVCVVGEVLVGPGELLERVALQGLEVLLGRGFVVGVGGRGVVAHDAKWQDCNARGSASMYSGQRLLRHEHSTSSRWVKGVVPAKAVAQDGAREDEALQGRQREDRLELWIVTLALSALAIRTDQEKLTARELLQASAALGIEE
jgi:hypothetical protein